MRPPKIVFCVQCNEGRPSSFVRPLSGAQGKAGVCFICVPRGKVTSEQWAARAQAMMTTALHNSSTKQLPREVRSNAATVGVALERKIVEREKLDALSDFFASWSAKTPHCACCQQISVPGNEVALDSNGNAWCESCARSVFACGRCVLHPGPIFFPALAGNPEPTGLLPEVRDSGEIVVDQGDGL